MLIIRIDLHSRLDRMKYKSIVHWMYSKDSIQRLSWNYSTHFLSLTKCRKVTGRLARLLRWMISLLSVFDESLRRISVGSLERIKNVRLSFWWVSIEIDRSSFSNWSEWTTNSKQMKKYSLKINRHFLPKWFRMNRNEWDISFICTARDSICSIRRIIHGYSLSSNVSINERSF